MKYYSLAFVVVMTGCGDSARDEVSLLLNLRTDLVSGVEFSRVRTERFDNVPGATQVADPDSLRVKEISRGTLFLEGQRVATFDGLQPGDHATRVRLIDEADRVVIERLVIFTLTKSSVFTIVMTRDCRGVGCPGPGDDPGLTACLGGRCVRPECTPETPELCPELSCVQGDTCTASAPCVVPLCDPEGVCLLGSTADACPLGQFCDPDVGCVEAGLPEPDAAIPDAAMLDSAVSDAAMLDSAVSDAGALDATAPPRDAAAGDASGSDAGTGDASTPTAPLVLDRFVGAFGNTMSTALTDMVVDTSGNIYFTGRFSSVLDFGGGPLRAASSSDIFLVGCDSSGNHLWSTSFANPNGFGPALALSSGGSLVMSGFFLTSVQFGTTTLTTSGSSAVYLAEIDRSNGVPRWAKSFDGNPLAFAFDMDTDANGNVYIAGSFSGSLDFGGGASLVSAGSTDAFVASFSSDGLHRWSNAYGGTSADHAEAIAASGELLYLAGRFSGTVDFSRTRHMSRGGDDVFLLALSSTDGSSAWVETLGGSDDERAKALAIDGNANAYLGGHFRGRVNFGSGPVTSAGEDDLFLASFDSAGSSRWVATAGSLSSETLWDVQVNSSGDVFLAGIAAGPLDLGGGPVESPGAFRDGLVASFDKDGLHRWSHLIGGNGHDSVTALAFGSSDLLHLGGGFVGPVDFGDGVDVGLVGDRAVFVVRYREAP